MNKKKIIGIFVSVIVVLAAIIVPIVVLNNNNDLGDTILPSVFSVGPSDSSDNVSMSINISITFSEGMNKYTVENAFKISNESTFIEGTYDWSGYTATFCPIYNLTCESTYTISLSTNSQDIAGNNLSSAFTSNFTTGNSTEAPNTDIESYIFDPLTDPFTDWTKTGAGSLSGIRLTSMSNLIYYTRSDIELQNKGFMIEVIVSAEVMVADGERGTRLRVTFPGAGPLMYCVEIRLERAGGTNYIVMYDVNSGQAKASIASDWTQSGDRLRIRMKRQTVGGTDYIFLQSEISNTWGDPDERNSLHIPNCSTAVALSSFALLPGPLTNEIEFGNFVSGSYYSDWESINIEIVDDPLTTLPYFPEIPPKPVLIFKDNGVGNTQDIIVSAYCSGISYRQNDTVTAYLIVNGTALIGETKEYPQDEFWLFTGLDANQTIIGFIAVNSVYGRRRTSPIASLTIPER